MGDVFLKQFQYYLLTEGTTGSFIIDFSGRKAW